MKNKKVITSLLLILTLSLSSIGFLLITSASNELPEYIPVDINSNLAGKANLPEISDKSSSRLLAGSGAGISADPIIGTQVYDWYIDYISGYTDPYMTLRAVVGNVEVWVQNDLSFPDGDLRNTKPWTWTITDEMAQYLAAEFDAWIYPKCAEYFGAPADRSGTGTIFEAMGWDESEWAWIETDNPQRVILKVLNYRDANYFDPDYPYYVAGFYNPTYTMSYYNRNMIHIDPWSWCTRLGSEGTSWLPDHPETVVTTRAYTYEAITAHEFQHNIHRDYIPDSELWMNEGCSMFSEILCEYGIPWGDINSYLATPDNSLTKWDDQGGINTLADYGQAALWTTYLVDQFGSNILADYVAGGIDGIEGLNAILPINRQFEQVYHDFRIANLIHSDYPGCGRYNYKTIDLSEANPIHVKEISGSPVSFESAASRFGTTITILGYDTYIATIGPYGSDYVQFSDFKKKKFRDKIIIFDGNDLATSLNHWTISEFGWYSGMGDLFNDIIYGEAFVDPADPWLTLTTYWDIEDNWDFGFVQVSIDDGLTWTSLENDYTTYDIFGTAIDTAKDNLPGLTGWSVDFIDMAFNLTDYSGETVLIGFRYVTDWADFYDGWYVDAVAVSGTAVTLDHWYEYYPVNYMVSIVTEFTFNTRYGTKTCFGIWEMNINPENFIGITYLPIYRSSTATIIISPIMDQGYADYSFGSLNQWK